MAKHYMQVEDFLTDESFLGWYFRTNTRDMEKWGNWIIENPDQLGLVKEAQALLAAMELQDEEVPVARIDQAEQRLMHTIEQYPVHHKVPVVSMTRRRWWMAAAGVVILLVSAYLVNLFLFARAEMRTNYGEIREQQLPDGTQVMLNANSRITFNSSWKEGRDREVWIKGEAFFHVRKTPERSRFIVHANRFDIIVTGTQFNVLDRDEKSNVMLKEGSVIIHTRDGKELKMKPGDFVELNELQIEKRLAREEAVMAWKDKKLLFDNTPLSEVLERIKTHYGVHIRLADDSIGYKNISGILPNDNLDALLEALEATTDFKIAHEDDEIVISRP